MQICHKDRTNLSSYETSYFPQVLAGKFCSAEKHRGYLCIKNTSILQCDHTNTYCHGDTSNELKGLFSQENYVDILGFRNKSRNWHVPCKQV